MHAVCCTPPFSQSEHCYSAVTAWAATAAALKLKRAVWGYNPARKSDQHCRIYSVMPEVTKGKNCNYVAIFLLRSKRGRKYHCGRRIAWRAGNGDDGEAEAERGDAEG